MEGNQVDEGQQTQGEAQETQVSVEQFNQLREQLEKFQSTNERLLQESKEYKSKYSSLRTEVESKQQAELVEKENWKELLEIEKNNRFEIEEQAKALRKTALKKELNYSVARHASDAYDVEDVINALPTDVVSIDEENLKVVGVEDAVNKLKETKPHLFRPKDVPAMMNSKPNIGATEKLTYEQELKSCTTQKQLDAVLAKYNRI